MQEIRIHGRGGQGSVTAAILIAVAAFHDGVYSQAFPYFGVERRGAPVAAFARLDNKKPVRTRAQIYEPDYIIVQDATLIDTVDVFDGAKKDALVIINSAKEVKDFKSLPTHVKAKTVPMTEIALKIIGKPIVNTMLLGAFSALTNKISLKSVEKAIMEQFSGELGKKNVAAAKFAYAYCKGKTKEQKMCS